MKMMKRLSPLLLTLVVLFASPSGAEEAAPRDPIETLGYDVAVDTQTFEVLEIDFDTELAFFRHVYRLVEDRDLAVGAGVDCAYPGLPAGHGEVLGIYDLGADSYRMLWAVAPPVRDRELCAKPAEVEKGRADAKAAVADFGFGGGKQPTRVAPRPDGTFVMPLSREGSAATLEVKWGTRSLDEGGSVAFAELLAGEKTVHARKQLVSPGRDATLTFHSIFVDDGRAVVLESVTSLAGGKEPRVLYSLSPVIDVEAVVLGRAAPSASDDGPAPSAPPLPDPKSEGPLVEDDDSSCASDVCVCGACMCGGPAAITGILGVLGCAACGEVCSPVGWLIDKLIPDDFLDDEEDAPDDDDGEPEPPPPEPGQAPDQFARASSSRAVFSRTMLY